MFWTVVHGQPEEGCDIREESCTEILINWSYVAYIQKGENNDAWVTLRDRSFIYVPKRYETIKKVLLGKQEA